MTTPKASPAFVQALRTQAERINIDYRPGAGVFDRYNGERLDIPGDMYSFFHALDLPHIAPQHRNWAAVIEMITNDRLAAPGSKRPIYFLDLDKLEAEDPYDGQQTLNEPRRTIDYNTGQPAGPGPRSVDIHAPRGFGTNGRTVLRPLAK